LIVDVYVVSFSISEYRLETRLITEDEDRAKKESEKEEGWWGSTGSYHKTTAVFGEDEHWYVGGTAYSPDDLKNKALAKLSPNEQKALGLSKK